MAAKILVVEDEDAVAKDIIECLTEFDYEVVGRASSTEGAIDLAHEENPDLILMDINLEGEKDGIDAAQAIREKGIPIIFLTAFTDKETLDRAKITEPFGYLVKPYKEIDLRTTIEVALHRAQSLLPSQPKSPVSGPSGSFHDSKAFDKTIFQFLRRIESLGKLPDEELEILASHAVRQTHKAGEFIAVEGDDASSGFIVESGRVAFMKSSSEGKDLIVELLPPGDVFGLLVSLDKQPFPYSSKVQLDSTLLWIPRAPIYQVLDRHPELSRSFFENVFSRLRESHGFARLLAHEKVEVRVAAALLSLLPHFAEQAGESSVLPITRQELADLTGTTQETCIRVTRSMEKEGVLDLSQNKLIRILDRPSLEAYTNKFS